MSKVYSLQWARKVFKGFYEIHGRGYVLFVEKHHCDPSEPLQWLRSDQAKWEAFKKEAKRLEH